MIDTITYKIHRRPSDWDSDDVVFLVNGKKQGSGFRSKGSSDIKIIRCPRCDRENYAVAIVTNSCAFCGFSTKDL